MRFQTEVYQLPAKTLNLNSPTTIREDFPLGDGWYQMHLNVILDVVIGTGTGAIAEGELSILKGVFLKTDTDGVVVNCAGRGLYRRAHFIAGCAPNKDAIAATTGRYQVSIPIDFASPQLVREEDTILDTSRYSSVELQLTMGGLADLFGTPGTATLAASVEISLVKTHGALPPEGKPLVIPYIAGLPPVNPANQTFIDLERSFDLAYTSILLLTCNSATGGVQFSGTPAGNVVSTLNIEDNYGFPVRGQKVASNSHEAKTRYSLETMPTGWYVFDFVKDASLMSAYPSGDKSKCQVNWLNDTLSTSGVTALISGVRMFKA